MKLEDIIKIADDAYNAHEKGILLAIHEELMSFRVTNPHVPGSEPRKFNSSAGDTLADFIVIELHETYDPEDTDEVQLQVAARAMGSATDEMRRVTEAFEDKL